MKTPSIPKVSVVIPNLNGQADLAECLDSLKAQSLPAKIIVVDNGSTDSSVELVEASYKSVELIKRNRNYGFTGGVNPGIRRAIAHGDEFVALLNNDARADKSWLKSLMTALKANPKAGIVTSKILGHGGEYLDSTGDFYTNWGLPYPRGRRETDINKYDQDREVFGASGGASLYRISMLKEIGLFDEDFFAYYEDVDLSFRAQLAGWPVLYEPTALVYHRIGATSAKLPGFATYHTIKNLPWLFWKNVPMALLPEMFPRFFVAYSSICLSGLARGQWLPVFHGLAVATTWLPKKLVQRWQIQRQRRVSPAYINSLIIHKLPPNAAKLRRLFGRGAA